MHIWLKNKINTVASAPTAPTGPVFMRIFSFFWDPVTKEQAVKGRTNLCLKETFFVSQKGVIGNITKCMQLEGFISANFVQLALILLSDKNKLHYLFLSDISK